MKTAKEYLTDDIVLCLCHENIVYTSKEKGVKALLRFLNEKINVNGFDCADKVVGKGAAFLYVLLQMKSVHASIMSVHAKEILEKYDILFSYDILVDRIINRDKTGFCPIEEAVIEIENPDIALRAINNKLNDLRS